MILGAVAMVMTIAGAVVAVQQRTIVHDHLIAAKQGVTSFKSQGLI